MVCHFWATLYVSVFIVCRNQPRSKKLHSWYTRNLWYEGHLYSGYTLRVFRYTSQELQVWMQSRIHRGWHWLHRWVNIGCHIWNKRCKYNSFYTQRWGRHKLQLLWLFVTTVVHYARKVTHVSLNIAFVQQVSILSHSLIRSFVCDQILP